MVLLAAAVSAVNPHTVQASSGGIYIENPKPLFWAGGKGNIDMYFHVFNSTGHALSAPETNCTIHIYNSTDAHVMATLAVMSGIDYRVVLGDNITTIPGTYPYIIQCSNIYEAGFISDSFEIGLTSPQDVSAGMPLAALIIAPMIFGLLLLAGSFMFGEDHAMLKIGLFLVSYLTIFISLWFGIQVVVRYYGFSDLQDSISTTTWVFGLIFFVIVSYLFIWAFIKGVEASAQKKQKELEY